MGEVEMCKLMLDYFIKEHYSHIWESVSQGTQRCVCVCVFASVCAREPHRLYKLVGKITCTSRAIGKPS